MEKFLSKKTLMAAGAALLAVAVLVASLFFFNNSAQAADGSQETNDQSQTEGTTPATESEEAETFSADTETSAAEETSSNDAQEEGTSANDAGDGDVNMSINDTRMRWNGEYWEYSTDGGETWTDTPPDGVKVDENGNINIWQGEGDMEDFDIDAYMQEVEAMIESIESEINERYGDLIPEGAESGSFFTYGDSIARKVDGVWEFSSDGGETWTNEPPEGIEVSEDGTKFRIGGGEGDIDDFDADAWLEEWYNEWSNNYENNVNTTGQDITV